MRRQLLTTTRPLRAGWHRGRRVGAPPRAPSTRPKSTKASSHVQYTSCVVTGDGEASAPTALSTLDVMALEPTLHARDLRPLAPLVQGTAEHQRTRRSPLRVASSVAVRGGAVVVRLLHLQALILHDSMMLFSCERPLVASCVESVAARCRDDDADGTPFEFRALEALLLEADAMLNAHAERLFPVTEHLLAQFEQRELKRTLISGLVPLRSSLSSFEKQLASIVQQLDLLLASDEDLSAMYLSHKVEFGAKRDKEEHHALELLLESYVSSFSELRNEVREYIERVASMEDITRMQMDHHRNRLIRLDLKITMITLSTGVTAAGTRRMLLFAVQLFPKSLSLTLRFEQARAYLA